ncbi:MAG: alternative ribosome rescue aminoacyl-tRNA hydrolase ArfB [Anaerolineae bacterium]
MPSIEDILQAAHDELSFEFVRASGPGGQNVNKVATSAQLRFDVGASALLPESARARLKALAGRRMTADGMLMIEARRYRTQEQNRADAIARFDALLRRALEKPKARIPTRASAASRQKRLESKKRRGEIKRKRQDRSFES